jgi:hypothetical protein
VKGCLIHNERDLRFRVWKGSSSKDSSNEKWEEEFRNPTSQQQSQPLNSTIDMQAMVANAF